MATEHSRIALDPKVPRRFAEKTIEDGEGIG
jgi:hypothetical protein